MSEGLRSPEWQITRVIARVSYGCPLQAIDGAFLLIERAGKHGEQVPSERIVHNVWDRQPVQADEISVQRSKTVAWMALVIMGPTRLWLGGVVSPTRDHRLTDRLLRLVRACCQRLAALLICGDGCAASPGSRSRAFRENVSHPSGIGRTRLEAWPEIFVGIILKHWQEKRIV